VTYSALEVMWGVAFGEDPGAVASQIDLLSSLCSVDLPAGQEQPANFPVAPTPRGFNAVVALTTSVEIALKSPFPRPTYAFALKFFPRLRRAMSDKNTMIKERLDAAFEKFSTPTKSTSHIRSATELIVQREVAMARKDGRKAKYDNPVIRDELFGLLVAGLDTTSITICWGLKFLTAQTQIQDRLRSVLQESFPRAHQEGDNPTVQEIMDANIPYLEAVIEEMHRLGGTASVGTRVALCDTQILGHHIPKGTDVFTVSPPNIPVTPPNPPASH
jgi:cytochrome P450